MADGVFDCLIIGGGASGLFAAARLIKESNERPDIAIIESGNKTARKLLLTGSGRCNLTNRDCRASRYDTDDPDKLMKVLEGFTPSDTIDFFESDLGVVTSLKGDLYYPSTYKSSTVTDALRLYLEDAGVRIVSGSPAVSLDCQDGLYCIGLDSGSSFTARNVILATGGASYPGTGSDGKGVLLTGKYLNEDDVIPFTPALVPLTSDKKILKTLAGVRCSCKVSLISGGDLLDSSEGEVLFTKEGGLSGICIMDISASALKMIDSGNTVSVVLDLMMRDVREVYDMLAARKSKFQARKCSDAFSGMMQKSILGAVMADLMLDPDATAGSIKEGRLMQLANALCGWEIPVSGSDGFDNAQVSAGGVRLSALTDTLCVKDNPGLYVIGEICNVNGICGGYNLQWAWASAATAARDIAYV